MKKMFIMTTNFILVLLLLCYFSNIAVACPSDKSEEKQHLIEGDIVGFAPSMMQCDAASDSKINIRPWRQNTLPYSFDRSFTPHLKRLFREAIAHIRQKTCIRFVPRTNQRNYIIISSRKEGCFSYLGSIGGGQHVNISPKGCSETGIIIHELIHAVGFPHEHQRADRDKHIRINWKNIKDGAYSDFDRILINFHSPYDYQSVMQYGRTAASKNGEDTITPLRGNGKLGQIKGLSSGDIIEINNMYCRNKKRGGK